MDVLLIVLAIAAAYFLFIGMTYGLAKVFFPKVDIAEDEFNTLFETSFDIKKISNGLRKRSNAHRKFADEILAKSRSYFKISPSH